MIMLAELVAAVALFAPAAAQQNVVAEDLSVEPRPGIRLAVRNKRPAGVERFDARRVVVMVHGATYPSVTFDVPLGGMSWMDYIARRGFDVYAIDLTGYGRSTRPPAMDEPADKNPPLTRGETAVQDIAAVVDFVRARRNVEKVSLIGWSWGTTLMATFAGQAPEKVERLALYAPVWIRTTPSLVQVQGPLGAYRVVSRDQALARWLTGVPEDKKSTLIPAGWFEQWADAAFATDVAGGGKTLRAPNGVVQDSQEFFGAGKPYYDPSKVRAPVLLVVAEWDRDTPLYMGQALFPLLVNTPWKRHVTIGEGTHTVVMEKNRLQLFEAVQQFLEESPPPS